MVPLLNGKEDEDIFSGHRCFRKHHFHILRPFTFGHLFAFLQMLLALQICNKFTSKSLCLSAFVARKNF